MFSKKLGGQRVGRLPAGPPVLGCEGNNPGGTYLFLHNWVSPNQWSILNFSLQIQIVGFRRERQRPSGEGSELNGDQGTRSWPGQAGKVSCLTLLVILWVIISFFVCVCVCFVFLDTARWADQPCLWYGCVFWRPSLWTGLYTMYFAFNLQNSQMISKFAGRSKGRKRVQRTGMMVGTWEASARLWLWYKFNLRSIVFDGNTQLFQNVF